VEVTFVFAALIVAVVAVLAWTWWSARAERDPASSVDTFSRALHAMQPSAAGDRPDEPERDAHATERNPDATERDAPHDPGT
jgi:predicted negative regulator of RcsB-dependent stress response